MMTSKEGQEEIGKAAAPGRVIAIIPVGSIPLAIDIHPRTGRVYVGNGGDKSVSVIDPVTNTVTATIPLDATDGGPQGIAVHAQTEQLYAAGGGRTVSVVDLKTNTLTKSIQMGNFPFGVAVDTRSGDVYVTNQGASNVSVIDPTTNTVVATIPVQGKPTAIMVQPLDKGFVYVVNLSGRSVSVIDPATRTVNATIPLPAGPGGLGPNGIAGGWPLNGELYVAQPTQSGHSSLSVIHTRLNQVIATIDLPIHDVFGVATSMVSGLAYVTHDDSNAVSRIDPGSHSYLDTLSTFIGKDPRGIAINQQSGRVYVANAGDNTVSVIDR